MSGLSRSPDEKRRLKGGRALRVTLRTVHIMSFAVLLGGLWFNIPRTELMPWLYWSVFSGAGLMALELWGGLDWLLQLAGGLTLAKLALLGLVPAFPEHSRVLLLLAVAAASIGSHMPSSLRHFNFGRYGAGTGPGKIKGLI